MVFFVLFFGLMTLVAGICAISLRNIVHCVLFAVGFFFGIACLFFTLHAEFIGAVQIVIYVGAIAILLLFAIMLTRDLNGEVGGGIQMGGLYGAVVAATVVGALLLALFKESLLVQGPILLGKTMAEPPSVTVKSIGEALMTPYVVPFEVVSVLLTAALVAAIVLALEQGGQPKVREPENRGGQS